MEQALAILRKRNLAPIKPSKEIPDPERTELDITKSYVAMYGGEIIGIASYIIHSKILAETASLAVHPAHRGKGAGYQLCITRLKELKKIGIKKVQTETDQSEIVEWLIRKFGYREKGKNPKKHCFGSPDIDEWTVLELDLERCKFSG